MTAAVFLSYSSRDRGRVDNLLSALRRAHADVWFDEELGGGDAWWQMILERIRGCDVFVFAMTDDSLKSRPCLAELGYARALGKPVLPIQIGPVQSLRLTPLATVETIDFETPTVDSGIRLVTAVQEAAQRSASLPVPLPEEPPVPFAYLMRLAASVTGTDLDPQRQVELLAELNTIVGQDADDPTTRGDLAHLLRTLRDRSDATRQTRDEAERLLGLLGTPALRTTDSPPPAAARRTKKWLITGAAVVAGSAVVVAGLVVLRSRTHEPVAAPNTNASSGAPGAQSTGTPGGPQTWSPTTGAAPPSVAKDQLTAILLSPQEVTAIMGGSGMQADPVANVMWAPPDQLSDPDCLGTDITAAAPVYDGSGWSAVRTQKLTESQPDDPDSPLFWVQQAAVAFPSADLARAFTSKSADQWRGCSGRVVKESGDAGALTWTYGDLAEAGDTLSQLSTQEGGDGWGCQHTLAAHSNAVFEAVACGQQVDDEAARIVAQMVQRADKP